MQADTGAADLLYTSLEPQKKKRKKRRSGGPAPQTAAFLVRVLRPRPGVKVAGLLSRAIGGTYDEDQRGQRGRRRGGDAGKGKKKDGPRFLLLQNPLPRRKAEPAARRKRKRWARIPPGGSTTPATAGGGKAKAKPRRAAKGAKAKAKAKAGSAAKTAT